MKQVALRSGWRQHDLPEILEKDLTELAQRRGFTPFFFRRIHDLEGKRVTLSNFSSVSPCFFPRFGAENGMKSREISGSSWVLDGFGVRCPCQVRLEGRGLPPDQGHATPGELWHH